MTRVTVNY